MAPRYSEEEARQAIAASLSYAEALRHLGMCSSGGGGRVLRRWVEIWGIPTDHFDPDKARLRGLERSHVPPRPLEELLVRHSTVNRTTLKDRLFREGVKDRACELCGQNEEWHGRRMALILDHINGVSDDNRLENLRIVCPNCNATLETHCGRNAAVLGDRACNRCGETFRPRYGKQRFCSRECASRVGHRGPRLGARRVERPQLDQLLAEVAAAGWEATGRRYGVTGNAVRKWVRTAQRERGSGTP